MGKWDKEKKKKTYSTVCRDVIRNPNASGAGLLFSYYVYVSTALSDKL